MYRDEEIAEFINDTLGKYSPTSEDLEDLDQWAEDLVDQALKQAHDLGLEEFKVPDNARRRIVWYYEDALQYARPDERRVWHPVA